MQLDDEAGLNEVFVRYRAALPDPEASADFMPSVWRRIEARRGFWPVFHRFARTAMAGCAALSILLFALNLMSNQASLAPNYADALVADHSAEKTFYAESVVRPTIDDGAPDFD
jgi:hypothetical protein